MSSALDWIKINTRLSSDPRVLAICESIAPALARYILNPHHAKYLFGVTESVTCHALRDVTVASLSRVWIAANEHTTDGVFQKCPSIAYIDLLSGITGFGAAMESVGWAVFDSASKTITLPNFTEHNSPDKNGHRNRSAAAERKAKQRERERLAAQNSDTVTRDSECDSHAQSHNKSQEKSVTPSVSDSVSISASVSDSEKPPQTTANAGAASPQPPQTALRAPSDPLGELKKRINALRPSTWGKAPHWTGEEEHALFEARHNLLALDSQDWLLLAWFFKFANSARNTSSASPVAVTTRRHTFVTELPAYLDRASTTWKQNGSPKLGTPAAPKPKLAQPIPHPDHTPAPPTDAFLLLAKDLGIPPRRSSPSPAPSPQTLPPAEEEFTSPAYHALVASMPGTAA